MASGSRKRNSSHLPDRLSPEWSVEEQAKLENGLLRYSSEPVLIYRYMRIASEIRSKTTLDVACRANWMAEIAGDISKETKEACLRLAIGNRSPPMVPLPPLPEEPSEDDTDMMDENDDGRPSTSGSGSGSQS